MAETWRIALDAYETDAGQVDVRDDYSAQIDGNGVPVGAAQRIAEQMLYTLGGSDIGVGLFASGGGGVWVRERGLRVAGHA